MDNTQFAEDAVQKVLRKIRETFTEDFKAYYEDDPILIPKDALPCVIVEGTDGNIRFGATGQDKARELITVRLVVDKREYIGASDDVQMPTRVLRNWVQARDATTGTYHKKTLAYIFRVNPTLEGFSIDQDFDVKYGTITRSQTQMTSEVRVTMALTEIIDVPERY